MEGWDKEEEREGEGTGRNSSWPMERLRLCRAWPLGGRDEVNAPRPSCWGKPRPSTNLWELYIRAGSPILCRRGIRLWAAGEGGGGGVRPGWFVLFWKPETQEAQTHKQKKILHGYRCKGQQIYEAARLQEEKGKNWAATCLKQNATCLKQNGAKRCSFNSMFIWKIKYSVPSWIHIVKGLLQRNSYGSWCPYWLKVHPCCLLAEISLSH